MTNLIKGIYRILKKNKGKLGETRGNSSNILCHPLPSFKSHLRPVTYVALGLILVLGPIAWLSLRHPQASEAMWWNDSYEYRVKVYIANAAAAQTNFQVSISLDTATLIDNSKMQADCDDIRVVDDSGRDLPHWLEDNCDNAATTIWVKVPNIPASGTYVYIYYGNATATSNQNGNSVFEFFDDFNYLSLDTSKWNSVNSPAYSLDGSTIYFNIPSGAGPNYLQSASYTNSSGFALRTRERDLGAGQYPSTFGFGTRDSTTANFAIKACWSGLNIAVGSNNGGSENFGANYTSDSSYHTFEVIWLSASASLVQDGTVKSTSSSSIPSSSLPVTIGMPDYGPSGTAKRGYYDWVAIRKATASDPTAGSPAAEETTPGPIAYWKFDEGADNTCSNGTDDTCDSSRNALDGTNNGATWQIEDMCMSDKCLMFDGSDDYVSIGDNDKLEAGTNFSISLWFTNLDTDTSENYLAGKYNSGNNAWLLGKSLLEAGDFGFQVRTAAGVNATASVTSQQYNDGNWHHVEGIKSGTTLYLYVDGNQVGSGTNASLTTTSGSADVYIGSHTGTVPWKGRIDDVKIYPYARSAAQVKTDYNAGKAHMGSVKGVGAALGNNNKNGEFLSEGLVGYWKMNENTGTTALDASGNGNTLTFGPDSYAPSWSTGKYGAGINFISDDYVACNEATCGGTNKLDTNGSSTTGWSVSAWINASTVNYGSILGKTTANGATGYSLEINPNKACYYLDNIGACSTTIISSDAWYQVTGVYNGSTIKLYLNGILEATTNYSSGASDTSADFVIGARNNAGSSYNDFFLGYIDEARIYNHALSPAEVSQLYNWAPGPIGEWKMDEGSVGSSYDTSGNGNLGTDTGTTITTGKIGKSRSFNGSSDKITIANESNFDFERTKPFTLETWFKTSTANGSFINKGNLWAPGYDIHMDSGKIRFYLVGYDGGAFGDYIGKVSTNTYNDGNWHHLVGTYDGSSSITGIKIYIDGSEITATDSHGASGDQLTQSTLNNYPLLLGYSTGWAYYLNGALDNARIFNYARTQKQIIEDMNADHPIPGSPISSAYGWWKFDEGADNTCSGGVNDICNSGSQGNTVDGTSSVARTMAGKYGQALNFPGNTYATIPSTLTTFNGLPFTISFWIKITSWPNSAFTGIFDRRQAGGVIPLAHG